MLGIETAAKSPPDGHTILVTTDVLASGPHVSSFATDYVKDILPVIQLTRNPQVLAVNPALGANSVAELIDIAKKRAGLSYATSGAGTQQNFVGEWFARIAGITLEHVPYRGAGQAINDLIGGHIMIAVLGPVAVIPHAKAGTLRILAQSTEARSPSLADVPTFEEAGVKGLVLETWQGALVPAGTPGSIIARLNAEMGKVLEYAEVREKLHQSAQGPAGGTPEQFARLIQMDSEKYARLARELKIKAE
jgi:tripartite-type tricarboxylate transporter receptor subunit TctC